MCAIIINGAGRPVHHAGPATPVLTQGEDWWTHPGGDPGEMGTGGGFGELVR